MADRRALVIDSPGSTGLRGVDELVPGPDEVVARPVHAYQILRESFGPRGKVILDVSEP